MPAGTLARTSTVVGRRNTRRRSYVPYKRGVVRKTSRRGAYKKGKKRQMQIRRAPFVETKRKTLEDLRMTGYFAGTGDNPIVDHTEFKVHDTEHTMMDPLSYILWSQGLDQSKHIGQAVNLKYTNMKIQVRFPQPHMKVNVPGDGEIAQIIPPLPQKYELVWGWVPAPLQLTGNTTPAANTVTMTQILNHVNHRVTDYFNSRKDRLRFIPKKDATLRIIGRRIVRPDLRFQSTAPPFTNDGTKDPVGTIPDYFTEISWKHNNRKMWLEQTGNLNGNSDLIGMYPNYSFLPFCTLINWNYDELSSHVTHGKKLECPSVCWNDITYFSDS